MNRLLQRPTLRHLVSVVCALALFSVAIPVAPQAASAQEPDSFNKVPLNTSTVYPMDVEVAPDGRVFFIERFGDVHIIGPNGGTSLAASFDVYAGGENGMLGLALAPDFASSNELYITYSPDDGIARDRVSRFTMVGNTLDMSSEQVIIEIPNQRAQCCHVGGAILFDSNGNLVISTGDNVSPFDSGGYTPIDERPGRENYDAQGSSANSNSLKGKILRIRPLAGGGYAIPSGNLFDEALDATDQTRPEIYAMGLRNPFRIGIDPDTDNLMVADFGPDARTTSATRGPSGRVEWNLIDQPGNYGWPYCIGDNVAYRDYDFETGQSGSFFDCVNGPVNLSPNNTGRTQLPPPIPATLWYGWSERSDAELPLGGAPIAGDVYRYDPANSASNRWPESQDGNAIFGEWGLGHLFTFQIDNSGSDVDDITRFLPGTGFRAPHAFDFGPDGALYLVEWGENDSGIYRIDYVREGVAPIAVMAADPASGPAPLAVIFSGVESSATDAVIVSHEWDFDNDGTVDAVGPTASHIYTGAGDFTARLTVTDSAGLSSSVTSRILVGNTAPDVEVVHPVNGGFFDFGSSLTYNIEVTDAEDDTIDCSRVIVEPSLGHDDHAHGYGLTSGCVGSLVIPGDEGHVGSDIFGVITASYTDDGAPGTVELTTTETVVLNPRRVEAEFFDATGNTSAPAGSGGVIVEPTTDVDGFEQIADIDAGDWWSIEPADVLNIDSITFRVATPGAQRRIEIRADSPTGPVLAIALVQNTGAYDQWRNIQVALPAGSRSDALYFVAGTAPGVTDTDALFNVNWMRFNGDGVGAPVGVGDVNCDDASDAVDALMILEFVVDRRTSTPSCPLPSPSTQIREGVGDVDASGAETVLDALVIAQCSSGVTNTFCD